VSNISGAGTFSSITNTGLTSGRVVYSTTGGLETDSANLTFDGTTLTAAGFSGPLNGTVGATTASTGAFTTLSATGVTTVQAGTAALPAITTSGDTNTGIFFPAADTIAFSEGGAEAMRIDSSGNVGIGTSSPVDLLQVNRSSGSGVTSGISLTTAAGAVGDGSYIKWTGATTGEKIARIDGVMEGTDVGSIRFNTGNGSDGFSERVRIDSSGNVGIGTSSPNASAILDAQSTTKGVRMPNMTTTQKNAISSPAAGLMVFDTTLAKLCVYSGSAWQTITSV
jgi:hypothetical protein